MKVLKRFGDGIGGRQYVWPLDAQVSFSDNFKNVVTQTVRMPGADGGFDPYGTGRSPHEIGSIQSQFWIFFDNFTDATEQIDAISALADWGLQRLVMQPTDPTAAERWCWARANAIATNENVGELPHQRRQIPLTFSVPDPRWFSLVSTGSEWETAEWESADWGEAEQTINASGITTDTAISYSGNAPTEVRVQIQTSAMQTAYYPKVQRLQNGVIVEEVRWDAELGSSQLLDIHPARSRVRLNYVSVFSNPAFDWLTFDWLTLQPYTDNVIRVRFEDASSAATVRLYYDNAYR